jgi:hypothetical protein
MIIGTYGSLICIFFLDFFSEQNDQTFAAMFRGIKMAGWNECKRRENLDQNFSPICHTCQLFHIISAIGNKTET